MPQNSDLLRIATAAARRGADQIRSIDRPENPADWGLKGQADFVTEVDRQAERAIVEVLREATPDAVVLGEELSPSAAPASLVWVVDPLDGTTNYLHQYPAYAVSIAAMVEGVLAVGVVLDVERDAVYHATAGGGAWCGDRRLLVSDVTDRERALIGTGFPFKVPALLPRYLRQFTTVLRTTSGVRRAGSAALDLVNVAMGRFDGFWELWLAPWDVAAGTLMVREAGGLVTDETGATDVVRHGAIVAGNPSLHAWLLEVANESDGSSSWPRCSSASQISAKEKP